MGDCGIEHDTDRVGASRLAPVATREPSEQQAGQEPSGASTLTPQGVVALQCRAGNQAVARMLAGLPRGASTRAARALVQRQIDKNPHEFFEQLIGWRPPEKEHIDSYMSMPVNDRGQTFVDVLREVKAGAGAEHWQSVNQDWTEYKRRYAMGDYDGAADMLWTIAGFVNNLFGTFNVRRDESDDDTSDDWLGSGGVGTLSTTEKKEAKKESPAELLTVARALIESANGELTTLIGQGGFGSVYEVPRRPDLLVKIATGTGGKWNDQLEKEAESLKMLQSAELPTAFIGIVTWTITGGEQRRGLLMHRVVGSFSKKVLKLGKFRNAQPTQQEIDAISDQTVRDLESVRDKCLAGNLDIQDLQFMISASDGSIKLIDPARAERYVPSKQMKPRDIAELMKGFKKRIDAIIRQVAAIAQENALKKKQ